MAKTLRDISLPDIRMGLERKLKQRSRGTPYSVRIERLAFPGDEQSNYDITTITLTMQIDYQQPTDTRPSEQQPLTDLSISDIEESLTRAVCETTQNEEYTVQIKEFKRTDEMGSLRIVMRALVPRSSLLGMS